MNTPIKNIILVAILFVAYYSQNFNYASIIYQGLTLAERRVASAAKNDLRGLDVFDAVDIDWGCWHRV